MDLLKPVNCMSNKHSRFRVVILVMMDLLKPEGLNHFIKIKNYSLNPCYDGSSKTSGIVQGESWFPVVLILVMMDLLKPVNTTNLQVKSIRVFILVMMDLLKPVDISECVGYNHEVLILVMMDLLKPVSKQAC